MLQIIGAIYLLALVTFQDLFESPKGSINGCYGKVNAFLANEAKFVGGIGIVIILLQILGTVIACKLPNEWNDQEIRAATTRQPQQSATRNQQASCPPQQSTPPPPYPGYPLGESQATPELSKGQYASQPAFNPGYN